MDAPARTMYLPNTMTDWPWPRAINPHFEDMKLEVDAAFRDFKALSPESQGAFDRCDFARLGALGLPNSTREQLRVACDLNNLIFLVDEYTDVEDAAVTKEMVNIVIDALLNPHKVRPEGECILGKVARDFWARAIRTCETPAFHRHFLEGFIEYLRSLVAEASDRNENHCRSIQGYLELRRNTIGARPCLALNEMGLDLPDEVFDHPVITELIHHIAEMVLIDNDMASFNREQATGDENHNFITTIVKEFGLDISGAMAWAARYHTEVQKKFIDGLEKVPSWGTSVDVHVKKFLNGIAECARANHAWCYESERYFGTRGPEIERTRVVPLLPKVTNNCKDAPSTVEKIKVIDLSKMMAQPSTVECAA